MPGGDEGVAERGGEPSPRVLSLGPPKERDPESSAGSKAIVSTGPVPIARVAPRKFKIMYTCKICDYRNSHMISRIAYTQGIVIATCPGCSSRHLLSDQTGLLDYGVWDVEMLARNGESVTRLGAEGYRRVTGRGEQAAAAARPQGEFAGGQLLVRREDGLIEALPESDVGIGGAAEFLSGAGEAGEVEEGS